MARPNGIIFSFIGRDVGQALGRKGGRRKERKKYISASRNRSPGGMFVLGSQLGPARPRARRPGGGKGRGRGKKVWLSF